jgi:catechol 2,3-dioxygenase-like lactoylglutathione lyase family enzyme
MKMIQTVLDAPDIRALAEFYRDLLGWKYRPGDEPPGQGQPDPQGEDWLVLRAPDGAGQLAFQQVEELTPSTWPDPAVPQQLHLDFAVPTDDELRAEHDHALRLGARVLLDRTDDPEEPLWVFADPAGHPFCIFVAPDGG